MGHAQVNRYAVAGQLLGLALMRYALSVAISRAGSRWGMRRRMRVHLGIHQLASPSSRISAGTSKARMTVASKMIPAARPIASGLISKPGLEESTRKANIRIKA